MSRYEEADEFCPHCDNHYVSHSIRGYISLHWLWMSGVSGHEICIARGKTCQCQGGMGERSGELGKETRRRRTTYWSGKATNEQHLTSGDRSEGT